MHCPVVLVENCVNYGSNSSNWNLGSVFGVEFRHNQYEFPSPSGQSLIILSSGSVQLQHTLIVILHFISLRPSFAVFAVFL